MRTRNSIEDVWGPGSPYFGKAAWPVGWLGRFRRLTRDYERLNETFTGWHWVAFVGLLLARVVAHSA